MLGKRSQLLVRWVGAVALIVAVVAALTASPGLVAADEVPADGVEGTVEAEQPSLGDDPSPPIEATVVPTEETAAEPDPGEDAGVQPTVAAPSEATEAVTAAPAEESISEIDTAAPAANAAASQVEASRSDATPEADDAPITAQQAVDVTLIKVDDQGAPLGAACFAVFEALPGGGLGDGVFSTCTNELGVIVFHLEPDNYILVETEAPHGFLPIANVPFTVEEGTLLTLGPFADLPSGGDGQFSISKVDGEGNPLGDSCFTVFQDLDPVLGSLVRGGEIVSQCDDNDDGFVLSRNQSPGDYILVESTTPPGFITAADVEFTIDSLEFEDLVVTNQRATGNEPATLAINKRSFVNGASDPLPGSCFQLFTSEGGLRGDPASAEVCDPENGVNDGLVTIIDTAGTYVLAETVAPDGFNFAVDRVVTLVAGQTVKVEIFDLPGTGLTNITVFAVDENGDPLGDVCFALFTDAGNGVPGAQVLGPACSNNVDGFAFQGFFAAGSYVLDVISQPAGYEAIDTLVFTHQANFNTVLIVEIPLIVDEPVPTEEPTTAPEAPGAEPTATAETGVLYLPNTGAGPSGGGGGMAILLVLGGLVVVAVGAGVAGLKSGADRTKPFQG